MAESSKKGRSVLDEIRLADSRARLSLLLKEIASIKKLTRSVLADQYRIKAILDHLSIDDSEAQEIIDFVRSLPEVKLSDTEKKDIELKVAAVQENKLADIESDVSDDSEAIRIHTGSILVSNG